MTSGPWDDYAAAATQPQDDTGPWTDFQPPKSTAPTGAAESATPWTDAAKSFAKSTVNALPAMGGIVGGILGTPADVVSGPGGNIAGAAIGGYLGTAAKNAINAHFDPENAPQTASEYLTQPVTEGASQGLMQGVGEAAAPLIAKGVGGVAKWAGAKALSNIGGVSPSVIKEYAEFAPRINAAPDVDALKKISDDYVGKLASDVDANKLTLDQANEAFKGLKSDLKDSYAQAGYDARDAMASATQSLKDAHVSNLKQVSGDVYNTINQLKDDVQAGSKNAVNVLDKSDAMIPIAPINVTIDSTIADLNKAGTDEALGVANKLQAYKDRLLAKAGGEAIAAPDAKKLIQGLDRVTSYNPNAGVFDVASNAAFKDIRSTLDQTLKETVPEYEAAMKPVSKDADLLNRVSDFGDQSRGAGILARLDAPTQLEAKSALQELGKKYGTDFVGAVDPTKLPENNLVNQAQAKLDALRPDRVSAKIDQVLQASKEKAGLDLAQSSLDKSKDALAPFKSLAPNDAGQTQAQQKLATLGLGKNIELTDMFKKLGSLTNTDFVKAMQDQTVLAAFKKGAYNGSRNAVSGGALGYMLGGAPGAAGGVAVGRIADQWGPAVTKKVLDGMLKVANTPTVKTIANLDLPDPIKKSMLVGLQNYLADKDKSATTPQTGPDKWVQQGLKSLGISDPTLSNKLLSDPKSRQLLIQASSFSEGSKGAKNIMNEIQKGWGQ